MKEKRYHKGEMYYERNDRKPRKKKKPLRITQRKKRKPGLKGANI